MIGVIGIGMVALPAGLLASGFSDQLHERRLEFEQAVSRILASGAISAEEGDQLRAIVIGSACPIIRRRRSSVSSRTSAARRGVRTAARRPDRSPPPPTLLPGGGSRIQSTRDLTP